MFSTVPLSKTWVRWNISMPVIGKCTLFWASGVICKWASYPLSFHSHRKEVVVFTIFNQRKQRSYFEMRLSFCGVMKIFSKINALQRKSWKPWTPPLCNCKEPWRRRRGEGGRLKSRASVFTYPIKTKLDGKMIMVIHTNL